jgi:hypothetical protein
MPSPLRENQQENDDQNTNVDHLKDYFYWKLHAYIGFSTPPDDDEAV